MRFADINRRRFSKALAGIGVFSALSPSGILRAGTIATLQDFGVTDFSGATDYTAQVQNAVDNCNGVLLWNAGIVKINGTVTITKPCRILGPGIAQWRSTDGAVRITSSNPTNTKFKIMASNVHLDGLHFSGTSARYSSGGKAIVVGDVAAPGAFGDGTITGCSFSRISTASEGVGIHFVRASNWVMDRCDIQGYDAVIVENTVADKGDSAISHCDFAADPIAGKCITQTSSGGLRISNSKFLTCQDSIYIPWTRGLSGGPIITGCSFENMTRRALFVVGNPAIPMHGLTIANNWINGGVDSIFIDDSARVSRALISGNNIVGGSTSIGINLGANMTDFLVNANTMDGNGQPTSYGIFVRSGASGRIGPNYIHGYTTPIYNASASTIVSTQL